jgi:hypothetical protein
MRGTSEWIIAIRFDSPEMNPETDDKGNQQQAEDDVHAVL